MKAIHTYNLTLQWTGNTGAGTSDYRQYERSHSVLIEHKAAILCSSDPAFRGDKTKHNPEELLVASLSSCHMLWYLHLCADHGIVVTDYVDHASGIMVETADSGGHFKEVTLHPLVTVAEASMMEQANALHHEANKLCFIANSCNFPVKHEAKCVVDAR
jgi:organic hydroperoxide reductase OsmC/OhrA